MCNGSYIILTVSFQKNQLHDGYCVQCSRYNVNGLLGPIKYQCFILNVFSLDGPEIVSLCIVAVIYLPVKYCLFSNLNPLRC